MKPVIYRNSLIKQKTSLGGVKIFLVVACGLIFLLSGLQIFLSARLATTGEKIKALENQKAELLLENNRLESEIHFVCSLSYIEKTARENLSMKPALANVEYISRTGYFASLPQGR